jgi:hypothetical protein
MSDQLRWEMIKQDSEEILEWNPRFTAYAKSQGNTEAEQLKADRARFPGGWGAGFMCWVGEQWRAFYAEQGRTVPDHIGQSDHAGFDAWLSRSA